MTKYLQCHIDLLSNTTTLDLNKIKIWEGRRVLTTL